MDCDLHCTKSWMCHTGHTARALALRGVLSYKKLEWALEMEMFWWLNPVSGMKEVSQDLTDGQAADKREREGFKWVQERHDLDTSLFSPTILHIKDECWAKAQKSELSPEGSSSARMGKDAARHRRDETEASTHLWGDLFQHQVKPVFLRLQKSPVLHVWSDFIRSSR